MADLFGRGVLLMLKNPRASTEVELLSGDSSGERFRGIFFKRFSDALLGRRRDIVTSGGSMLLVREEDGERVASGDQLYIKGTTYTVDSKQDSGHGLVKLTFEPRI